MRGLSGLTGRIGGAVIGLAVLVAAPAPGAFGAQPDPAAPAAQILGNKTIWRCSFVLRRPVARVGKDLKELGFNGYGGVWFVPDGKKADTGAVLPETAAPPVGWTAAEFDDGGWTRLPGPFFPSHHGHAYCKEVDDAGYLNFEDISPILATICVRGKFLVADPAAAGDLKLSLAFRGGVVAYLNGQEIGRANIPEEEKAKGIEALAEDYPQEVFVKPDGKPISWGFGDPQKHHALLQKRVRRLSDVTVPAKLLRKGANVLAVEAHRAPYHESLFGTSESGRGKGYIINWCTVGITRLELTASGAGVTPNVTRPAGIQVWNQPLYWRPKASDYGDPCESAKPIRLAGARGGAFSGAVMVGSAAPLRGLKAAAGELKGPGVIPASAVTVRYALADKEAGLGYETLSPEAPAEVAPDKDGGGAVLPVWITVKVPADARPGEYKGAVTVTADGAKPVEVGVELRVADWALPDPKSFVSHMGLTQSPESVAMRYKVEPWSPEHWALLEQCFAMLGQLGADDVFITALRRTHHGNEHAMIRWVKGPDGALKPDFSIAEKYLDLAIKHLGKVPVVCVYCWEPVTGSSYLGGAASQNKGLPITVVNPATGKLEEAEGPRWGTPEAREFWKPAFDGLREILKKRGLEGSLMVGVAGDNRPNKDAVEDLKAAAPEARWVVQSHAQADKLFGQPVGYLADVWGSPSPPDPAVKRVYGWQNPFLRAVFPRYNAFTMLFNSPLAQYRVASEATSASGIRGIGRVGADFWSVLEGRRSTYGGGRDIIARYPESDWGQLYLGNSTPYVLAPGPKGPLGSARFEMLREGAQDLEARVFIEKALLDPAQSAKLGEDLAKRCQGLLDDRVRAILIGRNCWQFFCGEQERLEKLYALAGEVAGKLGKP